MLKNKVLKKQTKSTKTKKITNCVNYCLKLTWKKTFFSVKIYVFRVQTFEMLKNEILKKQTKNLKFGCVRNTELPKTTKP